MEIRGHGGITHFGNSKGRGGVKTWKLSVVWYGYFLELPICSKHSSDENKGSKHQG